VSTVVHRSRRSQESARKSQGEAGGTSQITSGANGNDLGDGNENTEHADLHRSWQSRRGEVSPTTSRITLGVCR